MKKFITLSFLSLMLAFSACNNQKTPEKVVKDTTKPVTDMHNAQNSIDWAGSYFGVLPCASCPGINTLITLNSDGNYEKTVEYLE